ncbi:bifunctional oligoribonuclease/PAP phosphatase NrnA [Mycoplasmatota bacterium zrk1]
MSLFSKIIDKIEEYKTIIIHRHKHPDMDAYGSQLGLKSLIQNTYPKKEVYAVGSSVTKYDYNDKMDIIEDDTYHNALVIVVDTGSERLIDDNRYKNGDYLINIDHHNQDNPYGDIHYINNKRVSCCSIIINLCMNSELKMNKTAAELLYMGLITDSGRFLYNNVDADTFNFASYLISFGIDINYLYKKLYVTTHEEKKLNGYVLSNFVIDDGIAYIKFFQTDQLRFNTDLNTLKSGTINLMSNIKDVPIWVTFTEDNNDIYVELRGNIDVVEIAKKYGGGGHSRACGAKVKTWDEAHKIINDLKLMIKR